MITFDDVSVTYAGASLPVLSHVSAEVPEGELCLVVGPTGTGKSTLLGAACARVPHFSGGLLTGRVLVDGRDTRDHLPRDLADVVGVVAQDPLASFVTDSVEEELAFSMEQLGIAPALMRKRVEEVLDLLSLAPLRARPLADLSGGEQQRVAIGAVLTAQPRVLVLDEPTSALDPTAAEEVLAALARLVHDVGITVLLAEHRLERVVQFADRVISLADGGACVSGPAAEVLACAAVAPPVVELGRMLGWDPVPLTVRDARRLATPIRDVLTARAHPTTATTATSATSSLGAARSGTGGPASGMGVDLLSAHGVRVDHGLVQAVRGVDLAVRAGEIVALMGRNGSGKTSLLWALQGQGARSAGRVQTAAGDPAQLRPAQARRHVALVPATPADLLYLTTVAAECAAADELAQVRAGATRERLDALAPGIAASAHPRDLSEGQRLALAVAIQLAAEPEVLLLDEPTRGLDYGAKRHLASALGEVRAAGRGALFTSHDVEFVAGCADRVVVMADGEIVADGPTREVLADSATFAPQMAKVFRPVPVLTVADVRAALTPTGGVG